MLKILIADDERLIRNGLKALLDGCEGFSVTAAVSSGEEALKAVRRERPHVVLTDIRMPGMDGRALVRALHDEFPDVRRVVVSGYEDFNYAHETMKYGAIDYLLKPVDEAELIALLRGIEEAVRSEERKLLDGADMREKLSLSLPLLREGFVRSLLHGAGMDEAEIARRLGSLGVDIAGEGYCALVVSACGPGQDAARLQSAVEAAMQGLARFAACADGGAVGLIISLPDRCGGPGPLAAALLDGLDGALRQRVAIGAGTAVERLADIPASFAAAGRALEGRFLDEDARLFVSAEPAQAAHAEGNAKRIDCYAGKLNADMANAVELLRKDCLISLLEDARAFLIEHRAARSDALKLFTGMMTMLEAGHAEFKKALDDLNGQRYLYFAALEPMDTLGGIVRYTRELCCRAVDRMRENRRSGDKKRMEVVREYIDRNYMRPITLSTVSGMIYVNPNYFCEMFKAETGETFVDYLTRVRVEKAKALLRDMRIKTYEVGSMVGYEDSGYFCKVFKKLVGVTPGAYRKGC